jgi:light-regulated signal transduction histidine kinase (bacteriophytochrome)
MIPPGLRAKHREGLRRYLDAGEGPILGKRIEVPAQRRDGSEFPAEVAVVRIQTGGAPIFTGYIRDITERRRAAEAAVLRREKQAAEEANAELEAFSYSVAHDLRAPLRAINGFSLGILNDHAGKLDDEAKEYLSRIVAGAERMARLIDALLDLAKLARAEPQREAVDLSALARKTVDQLRSHDPARKVEAAFADGVVAQGDPHLVRAVLENLLANAWKFSRLRQPARIEFGREELEGVATFYVRDNGAGFDMALAKKLFVPFRRLHSDAEFGGNGIGLATVQRIVRRHGGRVWAEGAPGKGATFRFTLSGSSRGA